MTTGSYRLLQVSAGDYRLLHVTTGYYKLKANVLLTIKDAPSKNTLYIVTQITVSLIVVVRKGQCLKSESLINIMVCNKKIDISSIWNPLLFFVSDCTKALWIETISKVWDSTT